MSTPTPKNKLSQIVFDSVSPNDKIGSMYLQTLPNKHHTLFQRIDENVANALLNAEPEPIKKSLQKPDSFYIDDIDGAKSKLSFDRSKPCHDIMNIKDIPGTTPCIKCSLRSSKRCINPVAPIYKLPSFEPDQPFTRNFIRDSMKNDDVEGSSPKKLYTEPVHDPLKLAEVFKPKRKLTLIDRRFDVRDINNDGIFVSRRMTDPLVPIYHIDGEDLEVDFGRPSGARSSLAGSVNSLDTSDIDGAQADSATEKYRKFKRFYPESSEDSTILVTPGISKQEVELERQRLMDFYRGEKIRKHENRHLSVSGLHSDVPQTILHEQREKRKISNPSLIHNTF